MPNNTVPANATALPTKLGPQPTRFMDFDADDSGAMQHVIVDDPPMDLPSFGSARCHAAQSADMCACGAHVTAFKFRQRNFASFYIKDLRRAEIHSAYAAAAHVTTHDPHEAFLVAFKTLIAATWSLNCTDIKTVAR